MNILETIVKSGLSGNILDSLTQKSGLDASSLQSVVAQLAPQLLNGAKANLDSDNDSSSLIDMIAKTNLDDIERNPQEIDNMDTTNMAGELFSSLNENEDDVANAVSSKTGIDASSISSLIPMLAPLIMGALNKQTNLGASDTSDTNGITSMLTNFIDQDNDGSVVDDLMSMAGKFFR